MLGAVKDGLEGTALDPLVAIAAEDLVHGHVLDDDLVDKPRRSPATVVVTHDDLRHIANLISVDVELVDSAE